MTNSLFRSLVAASLVALGAGTAHGADADWTGPAAASWNDGPSWSPGVPVWDANAWITNSSAQTIANESNDTAWSPIFSNQSHTLLGGNLWLGSGLLNVEGAPRTATINSSLAGKAGLIKNGGGTLTLGTPMCPSNSQRLGVVAMDVEMTLDRDGEGWKGTYKGVYGSQWTGSGRIVAPK